jgi:hypothetical protein
MYGSAFVETDDVLGWPSGFMYEFEDSARSHRELKCLATSATLPWSELTCVFVILKIRVQSQKASDSKMTALVKDL